MFRRITLLLVILTGLPATALTYKITSWATVGLSGSFRLRVNSYYNADLGRGGHSGWHAIQPESTSTWADMRLRVEPWIDAAGYAKVRMRLDFLDNFIFGSAPSNPFFENTRASMRTVWNSWKHSVRVKMVWIEVPLFQRLMLYGGRMPDDFGLGILRNSGSAPDSDVGDSVDGIRARIRVSHNVYFQFGWEMPYEGAVSGSPARYMGPVFDLEQSDDINRWVLLLDSKPTFPDDFEELASQTKRFDFGFYNALTKQNLSSERLNKVIPYGCAKYAGARPFGIPYNCYTLSPRGAFMYNGSLWLRYWQRRKGTYFRFESELTGQFGKIDHVQSFTKDSTSKTFLSFGLAVELELKKARHQGLLYLGAASGDNVPYFGVTDNFTFVGPDDRTYKLNPEYAKNDTVTSFLFSRDYHVDSILFREVIGTVTNAVYFKPAYFYTLVDHRRHHLSLGAWVLIATAFNNAGTPGHAWYLGTEPGIGLRYNMGKHLQAALTGSVLIPGAALNEPGRGTASVASGMRMRITASF